jgi:hypothetical protein
MVGKDLDALLKKVKLCQTKKCSKLNAIRMQQHKMYMKSQKNMQCPTSSDDYINCISAFYENSNYKKANDEFANCSKEKCEKERAPVDKLFNKFLSKQRPSLARVGKSRKITRPQSKKRTTKHKTQNTKNNK